MNKEKRRLPFSGGSSLLVIFSVLCLTVFAMLALSTVKADLRMADASVKAIEEYYRADCRAEEILGKLRKGEIPEGVAYENDRYAYVCPVSDTQALSVVVCVSEGRYDILQWKVLVTEEWSPQEYLNVWTPETED